MAGEATPVELEFTLRHVGQENTVKEYASDRLGRVIRSLPNLRAASLEVTFEGARSAEERYVVQVTLEANGTMLRVEERGPAPVPAIDRVHDTLERRIRDWKGRVYFERRQEGAAYKEAVETERAALPPEDKTGQIIRMKSHELKPMFPEDAVEQMELLGHDFFFFLNGETGQHNVLYRRKAGGYGLIEPAIAGVPTPGSPGGGQQP